MENKKKSVVILAGGLARRFKVLQEIPKCMIEIYEKPLLHILINYFLSKNFKVYISLGHLHRSIVSSLEAFKNKDVFYRIEDSPLGTGGAIRFMSKIIDDENFLVINGDTFNNYKEIDKALKFHNGDITQIIARDSNQNKGTVISIDNKIVYNYEYKEMSEIERKNFEKYAYSSTGAYIMNSQFVQRIMKEGFEYSLEKEILPDLVTKKLVDSVEINSNVRDLGTLIRLEDFKKEYNKVEKVKSIYELNF